MAGITVEADKLRHQRTVAATARQEGLTVTVEPLTERLTAPGFAGAKRLGYARKGTLEPSEHLSGKTAREAFVAEVLDLSEGSLPHSCRRISTCGVRKAWT